MKKRESRVNLLKGRKLLEAIKMESRRDRRIAKKCGSTCGEQDCSEVNCSNYCHVPPHQD